MRLGLNARERCDMVTYWLLQLESYPFNVIYFVDRERYAQAAKLDIVPTPDVVIRVFMVFRWATLAFCTVDTPHDHMDPYCSLKTLRVTHCRAYRVSCHVLLGCDYC